MEIYIYDLDLTLKGVIDEITSFIWIRRYWSVGEFKLLVPFTPYNVKLLIKDNLIIKRGDREAALITYVNIKKNEYGLEEIEVQGKFTAVWLDKRIMLNPVITTARYHDIINRIVYENIINPYDSRRKIPIQNLNSLPNGFIADTVKYSSEPFISSLLAVEALAKAAKLGFEIQSDVKAKIHYFTLYTGNDYTVDQNINPPCVFSHEFDNISEQEFLNSVETYKNMAYVGGEAKEGVQRQIVELGSTTTGFNRNELFVNASDITQTYRENGIDFTMPMSTYLEVLRERGFKELENYIETLSFTSKINAFSNLEYKKDFDIGDKVTCVDKRWNVKINVRITEITENYQRSKHEINVVFGESLPTLSDKLKKMR